MSGPTMRLTPRELELLRLLSEGWSVKEAAANLQLTAQTASMILFRARERVGALSNEHVIAMAFRARLLT